MPALELLRLDSNNLSGEMPTSLIQLGALERLSLSFNSGLSGDLAELSQLGSAATLERLDLGENAFTGDLSVLFSDVLPQLNLDTLILYRLPSIEPISFPQNLNLTGLRSLTLDGRNFTAGAFPPSLAELDVLSNLNLQNFEFTLPLPAEIADLSALQSLVISDSTLPGTLPPEIADVPNLFNLTVVANRGMSGGIPEEVGQLGNLYSLDLSSNDLGGDIPASLGNLTNLRTLDLSENQHTGTVPQSLEMLGNLSQLDLSNNLQLTGLIPSILVEREDQGLLQIFIDNTQLIRAGGRFSSLGGLWFDPALDGAGFNFVALSDSLIATFYGYGPTGQQLWLTSGLIPAPTNLGEEIADILMVYGNDGSGRLQAPQPSESLVEWGRMSLRIDSCTTAQATLDGADGQVTMDLQQLIANEDTACSLSTSRKKLTAPGTGFDSHTAQLVDQYRALKALKRAGGEVSQTQISRVLQQLYQPRMGKKVEIH